MSNNIIKWHDELLHAITQQDMKDAKRGRGYSMYALPQMLKAANEARDEALASASRGAPEQDAFIVAVASNFNPAPFLRTFLRKLDATVDVQRGRWVRTKAAEGCSCPR